MNEDQKKIIKQRLLERITVLKCPMCNHNKFILLDGYLTESLQDDYHSIVVGSETLIPTAAIACKRCGFVARFALGALDLLPDSIENIKLKENKEEKPN